MHSFKNDADVQKHTADHEEKLVFVLMRPVPNGIHRDMLKHRMAL